jgi:putative tryptophan/tyrosine transport system substrate-binding protein
MRRREFLGLFGGLSTTIVSGAARGEARKRVALVSVGSTPVTQMHEGSASVYFRTFFEELRRLGYVEGKNLVVLRFTSGGIALNSPRAVTGWRTIAWLNRCRRPAKDWRISTEKRRIEDDD